MFKFLRFIWLGIAFLLQLNCFSQEKSASIRLLQGDSVFTIYRSTRQITLIKKTFKIQVLLQNLEGVYVCASFRDSLDKLADLDPVPGFDQIPAMLAKEEEDNKEKELVVSDEHWVYWSKIPSGFNKKLILLDDGKVVGTKTIKQLFYPISSKTVKLKDIRRPLYVFFVGVAENDNSGKPVRELFRQKIRIDWIDED